MGQSETRVKEASNIVTSSCDSEGVAQWVEEQLKE